MKKNILVLKNFQLYLLFGLFLFSIVNHGVELFHAKPIILYAFVLSGVMAIVATILIWMLEIFICYLLFFLKPGFVMGCVIYALLVIANCWLNYNFLPLKQLIVIGYPNTPDALEQFQVLQGLGVFIGTAILVVGLLNRRHFISKNE